MQLIPLELVKSSHDSVCKASEAYSWLACDVIMNVLKFKTKETPKFLSSSGIKGAKSISVDNVSAQQLASSGNQRIFNFRVMVVCDIKLRMLLSKNIYTYLVIFGLVRS